MYVCLYVSACVFPPSLPPHPVALWLIGFRQWLLLGGTSVAALLSEGLRATSGGQHKLCTPPALPPKFSQNKRSCTRFSSMAQPTEYTHAPSKKEAQLINIYGTSSFRVQRGPVSKCVFVDICGCALHRGGNSSPDSFI